MRRNEKGFTLIELLIVVIILGILAIIGIPKFLNNKADAQLAACKTNLSALEDAEERYHFDKSSYTNNQQDLVDNHFIKGIMYCPASGTYTLASSTGTATCGNASLGHKIHD